MGDWTASVTGVEILDKPLRAGSRALIRQPELLPAKFRITAPDGIRAPGVSLDEWHAEAMCRATT